MGLVLPNTLYGETSLIRVLLTMSLDIIGLFVVTWAQIAPIYLAIGRLQGQLKKYNNNHP